LLLPSPSGAQMDSHSFSLFTQERRRSQPLFEMHILKKISFFPFSLFPFQTVPFPLSSFSPGRGQPFSFIESGNVFSFSLRPGLPPLLFFFSLPSFCYCYRRKGYWLSFFFLLEFSPPLAGQLSTTLASPLECGIQRGSFSFSPASEKPPPPLFFFLLLLRAWAEDAVLFSGSLSL